MEEGKQSSKWTKIKNFIRRAGWGLMALLFLITGLGVGVVYFIQSLNQNNSSQTQQSNKLVGTKVPGFTPVAKVDKLEVKDLQKGTGKDVKADSTITVQYIGALAADGTIFDTTIDRNQPFTTKLDAVIRGWQGLIGMKVGGERQLLIPADLAYGSQSPSALIPPNSDLMFDVTLISVK